MEKFLLQKRLYEFSVSDILLMSKCKKALELKLKGYKVNVRFETLSYTGALFHNVLNKFSKSLEKGLFHEPNLKENDLHTILREKLYEIFFNEISKDNKSNIDIVWKYLENFSVLIATLAESNNFRLRDIFVLSEKPFKFRLLDNVSIKGRFDVLLRSGESIKIVDYKTGKADFERDTLQISLYYEAIRKSFGVEAEPIVMYFRDGKIISETYTKDEIETALEVIKHMTKEFIERYENNEVSPSKNKDICKYCNMKNYSFCKFT